ncbi:MAG TPA: polysaccharide deacetylase family protein [Solirubrobacteraceae bacterium]|nr:polysaccharide deacetylase family protein [Solirubrobacteraceae bacterium]
MSISVTVDVDGLAGLACRPGGPWDGRLTSRSEHEFVWRGLERVLDVLAGHGARATFYVPGQTVAECPQVFAELVAAGHEIGHHGHAHLPTSTLDAAAERDELLRGLDALAAIGVTPRGYRSPGWELTPRTLALLPELGFAWDSSLMGDERPYRLGDLVELPVHWRLDDVPYFTRFADPRDVVAIWTAEHECAAGHLTYTIHPEVTGRGAWIALLQGLLDCADAVTTHGELCAAVP